MLRLHCYAGDRCGKLFDNTCRRGMAHGFVALLLRPTVYRVQMGHFNAGDEAEISRSSEYPNCMHEKKNVHVHVKGIPNQDYSVEQS